MTLAERLIEFNSWSTARKTLLLTGIGVPAHLLAWSVTRAVNVRAGFADIWLADLTFAGLTATHLVCLMLSLLAVRAGKEARWIAYLLVTCYTPILFGQIYILGTWSTPAFATYPLAVITVALWYDERVGWFAFTFGALCLTAVIMLQSSGVLIYAPALVQRSIDAQSAGVWAFGVMEFFVVCFAYCILVVAARRLQERKLRELHEKLERGNRLIRRYVPAQIADAILSGDDQIPDKHERRKLTIFFSDLVGFTDISEELEPEDLSRVLNEYFSAMTAIAQSHGGTVDELSGDAILIFFGAPHATDDKDHALRAVRMAIDMQNTTEALNKKWSDAGIAATLRVRVGIDTGLATVGNFGSPERMKYAAMGRHVNLAARLQAQSEPGGILLSHTTWLLVQSHVQCVPKGELTLKGFHKPVMVYEVAEQGADARAQPGVPADGPRPAGSARR